MSFAGACATSFSPLFYGQIELLFSAMKYRLRRDDLRKHFFRDDSAWCMGNGQKQVCDFQNGKRKTALRLIFAGFASHKFL